MAFATRKTALLLAFLATYPETSHSREELADRFWCSNKATRTQQLQSLASAYHALRRQFGADAESLFFSDRRTIGMHSGRVQTDTGRFEALLLDTEGSSREKTLEAAVALYKGPFCADFFDINDHDIEQMWIAQNRLRFALLHAQALAEMAQLQAAGGDRRAAVRYALDIPNPHSLSALDRTALRTLLLQADLPPDVLQFTLPDKPRSRSALGAPKNSKSTMATVNDFLSRIEGIGSRASVSEREAIRTVLEAEVQQLPHDAQALLPQLSVFTEGCTAESAFYVCRCRSQAEAERLLEMLTERHLIVRNSEEGVPPRYRLPDTLASLLQERLSSDERLALVQRLARWLLRKSRDFIQLDAAGKSLEWSKMMTEEGNTRILLETILVPDGPPHLWKYGTLLLLQSWYTPALSPQSFDWLCRAETLPLLLSARSRLRLSLDQIRAAMHHPSQLGHQWVLTNAARIVEDARKLGKQDKAGEAFATLAVSAHYRGEGTVARQMFPLALQVFPNEASLMYTYAEALTVQGKTDEAQHYYERALQVPNLSPDYEAVGKCFYAGLRIFQGEYEEAEALLDTSLLYCHNQIKQNYRLPERIYRELGLLYLTRCRFGQAREAFLHSQAFCVKLGDKHCASDAQRGRGLVALRQGDLATARELFTGARTVWEEPAHSHWLAVFSLNLSETACYAGDLDDAEAHLREADGILSETAAEVKKIEARYLWGLLHLRRGAARQAVEAYREALRAALKHGGRYQIITAAEGLATALVAAGDAAHGARLLGATASERVTRGIPLPPIAEPDIQQTRQSICEVGAEDEYQAGKLLTLEQAIEG